MIDIEIDDKKINLNLTNMATTKEIVDLIFEADADKDGYLTRQEIVDYLATGVSKRQID